MDSVYRWFRAALVVCFAAGLSGQTEADYLRANSLRQKMQGLALNVTGPMNWIGGTDRFWYRKSVAGGNVFIVMDAAALGEKYTALTLPFTEFTFVDDHQIQFVAAGSNWHCDLNDYSCRKTALAAGGR